jgi:hypothetical protein
MRVGNGQRVDVMAEGSLHLRLPSGMIFVLNKCYYVPALSMNIVSGSRLSRDGYHVESITNGCSISKDGVFYVHVADRDGLYILVLLYIITACMLRDANMVMIMPQTYGIAVLVILA